MIDLHAHVLPGLDDGPRTIRDALALLRQMADQGITSVVATPHMRDGHYDVTVDQMHREVERLNRAAVDEEIPITVLPGGEVALVPDVSEAIRCGTVPSLGALGRFVLIEMPFQNVPVGVRQVLFAVQLQGVTPVLAHPERSFPIQRVPSSIEPFVRAGALVQINAESVVGRGGRDAERTAARLLERGLVHVVASDAHDAVERPCLLGAARDRLIRLVGAEEAYRLVRDRPLRILEGRPFAQPRARGKALWWKRVLGN